MGVTLSHKFIVANAKEKRLSSIAVLEEDFVEPSSAPEFDANESQTLVTFLRNQSWELLRLGWIARQMQAAKKPKSRADCQDCTCTLETQWSQKLCRLQSGCTQLKSTV